MPISDYTPTTAEVAKLIRARTKDKYGNEVGDFTADTEPTADEATGLIAEAVDEIASAVGPDVPDGPDPDDPETLRRMTKRVVSLLAAANVELSYFPEQAGQAGSAYQRLMERIDGRSSKDSGMRGTLLEAVAEAGGGGSGQSVAGPDDLPQGDFPPPSGWMGARF
jgi:hypothetical protein